VRDMETYRARLLAKTAVDPSGCWLWSGHKNEDGYGVIRVGARTTTTHRLSYRVHVDDPGEKCVLHHCDTPACVNPGHLFLGTHADNVRDRHAKGRDATGERHVSRVSPHLLKRGVMHGRSTRPERTARGERHGNAVLNAERVRAIRARGERGQSIADIAAAEGVSEGCIYAVIHRRTWRHV
jgi:hypothetical protein